MKIGELIVAKFGGTSLADADQFKKVIEIVKSDKGRQYVVVSAPGKRNPQDQKITDLFYEWHRLCQLRLSSDEVRDVIKERYQSIVDGLGINFPVAEELDNIGWHICEGVSADYAASRGEYLSAMIMAKALPGYEFVDAAELIRFDEQGRYQKISDHGISNMIGRQRIVIPGFYGSMPDGSVKTFSRGGSDITGAIIARAVSAGRYENWTDVSGLLMADPRVVNNPRKIEVVTYRELRELAYMGANVFHEEAMFPVQDAGIITNIRNTNNPSDQGTLIMPDFPKRQGQCVIAGVAGRKNFTVITVEKALMNQQVGFVRRILTILEEKGISFDHMPTGVDTLSLVIEDKQLYGKIEEIVYEIKEKCSPDLVEIFPDMAMLAVVGRGMAHTPGVAAKIFAALAAEKINVRMIDQGSSEISILIGVENNDYENAVRAIYGAFVDEPVGPTK